jgi:hypothetical protein
VEHGSQLLKKLLQQCLFLGAQQKERVKTVTGDILERPASAIRADALTRKARRARNPI